MLANRVVEVPIRGTLQRPQVDSQALNRFVGLFLLVAGALLLTPGFFTDAIGFLCLLPPLRRTLIRTMLKRGIVQASKPARRDDNALEGTYRRTDD